MENIELTGIYKIVSKTDGKTYYGSARVSFKKRWRTHKWELQNGIHHCHHLQNAYNLYGPDNFTFDIIMFCDPEDCFYYEQQYLDKHWDGGIECYNQSKDATGGIRGRHHSNQGKKAIGAGNLGKMKVSNVSGFAGVSFDKTRSKWVAVIAYKGKPYHLGRFDTTEEANIVYQEALELIRNGKELPARQRKLRSNNKSGYEGVFWNSQKKKWRAEITINYRKIHIGFFDHLGEASKAYQKSKLSY